MQFDDYENMSIKNTKIVGYGVDVVMAGKSGLVGVGVWRSALLWYHKTSNMSGTLVGNKIVDHSDVVGASPVGAAPTTSPFST